MCTFHDCTHRGQRTDTSGFSFYYMDPRNRIQVIRSGNKHFYSVFNGDLRNEDFN